MIDALRLIPIFVLLPFLVAAQTQDPPFSLPDSVELRRDVVYARYGDRAMKADLFLPKSGEGPFPAVVYIHGGGWKSGSKAAFQRQAAFMATQGFVGICIEMRLSGEAQFPAPIHDAKAAVRYLRAEAKALRVDASRIGAAGGSSGGHVAAMLAVTAGQAEYEGQGGSPGFSSTVQAVALFNPAVDLVSFGERVQANATNSVAAFLGESYKANPGLWKKATPITYVSAQSPPMLFLHGDSDKTVPIAQPRKMEAALKAAGVRADFMVAPGADHAFFNRPPWFEPTLKRMAGFFASTLQTSSVPSHSGR
ncbi:MAG: alpha/beta hydrolase [Acidobacteriota bacterium]